MPYTFKYSRWDGTQRVAPFDAEDLLEAMADDLMADGDLKRALRKLMHWGGENRFGEKIMGLQDLIERLRQRRRRELDRYDLGSVVDEIRERLERIKQLEREGIQRKLDEARGISQRGDAPSPDRSEEPTAADDLEALQGLEGMSGERADEGEDGTRAAAGGEESGGSRQRGNRSAGGQHGSQGGQPGAPSGSPDAFREMLERLAQRKLEYLDQLPSDLGGQIKALSEYEFMDPTARQQFQELLEMLQKHMLNNMFRGMQQALQSMTPQQRQGLRDMLRDLNQMLRDAAMGQRPNFEQFMQRHGHFFPPGISSLEELLEHLARSMAQMQSLLNSMSPEQREQLQSAMEGLLSDPELREQLTELSLMLQQLMPGQFLPQRYPFRGDDSLTFEQAMRLMEQLQEMDELERDLKSVRDYQDLEAIDPDRVRELLGEEEATGLEDLRSLAQTLEEAGLVERQDGKLQLTPRAIRKIGDKALRDIFSNLKRNGFGNHQVREQRGVGGERLDETKPYEFGDPMQIDIGRTVMNSVIRSGRGTPLRLHPEDFEVYRNELATQSATVLLLDMSRSMLLRGCFLAAKKVAMALESLIKTQYPKDQLLVVGFSYIARELKADTLTSLSWEEYEYGTNLQHGLQLAREWLAKSRSVNKEIIVITDGEPTAHFEGPRVSFAYPPTFRTIQETLKEVRRCTKERIVINTFMLETGEYLMSFVEQMTKINRGRAFYATPDKLGEYVLVDYVTNKSKRIR
ncbi:MAG: VWA domain-containing protein [Chloroflexota bacterium]|nr:VWA domain-containing protein [Dehalococcoidia bacterium]MDW8253394.1 VWA domain-containing protein [Chloroflexota bacterium]